MINLKETLNRATHYWANRRQWREATTVQELGERGAAWARGELPAHPGGYDVPDPETESLLPILARANAAGLFTHQSQPGGRWEINGVLVEQRAFVSGFLARDELPEFRRHLEGAGMLVLDGLLHEEPLSKEDGVVVTGGRWTNDYCLMHLSSAAHRNLDDAADLDVIDLVWCRENALWDALEGWMASRGA
jgi:hypothetical protein